MRETSVLYQQMLRAYISECEGDPRLPTSRVSRRDATCVYTLCISLGVSFARWARWACTWGEGREREATGLVRRVGQPAIIRNPGAQVCEKRRRRPLPIGLAFSRTPLGVDWHWQSSSERVSGKFITSNWNPRVWDPLMPSRCIHGFLDSLLEHQDEPDAVSCVSMPYLALRSLTMRNCVIETLPLARETTFCYYGSVT